MQAWVPYKKPGPTTYAAAFLLLLLTAPGCNGVTAEHGAAKPEAVVITTARVRTMDVSHDYQQTGALLAGESVLVKSEAVAAVREICFEEGEAVQQGAVLVRLDNHKLQAEVRRLEARIDQLTIERDHVMRTLERKRRLRKGDVLSEQDIDDLESRKGVQDALLRQAQAELQHARAELDDTVVRAPFSGITSERLVAPGDYLQVADPVVRMVQVDPLKVSLRVFETCKRQLIRGMPVRVSVSAYPGETFTGSIYFISPDVDPATRSFLVKAIVPNGQQRLNPGMFAAISVTYDVHRQALVIPAEALVQLDEGSFVFRVADGAARKVPVSVLKTFDGLVEVAGDLADGQQLVFDGKYTVTDGRAVRIVNSK